MGSSLRIRVLISFRKLVVHYVYTVNFETFINCHDHDWTSNMRSADQCQHHCYFFLIHSTLDVVFLNESTPLCLILIAVFMFHTRSCLFSINCTMSCSLICKKMGIW
jgi:hypothetical protein